MRVWLWLEFMPGSGKAYSLGEDAWEGKPSEHQMQGWRAASAAGSRGQGLRKRSLNFADTGMMISVQTFNVHSLDVNVNFES